MDDCLSHWQKNNETEHFLGNQKFELSGYYHKTSNYVSSNCNLLTQTSEELALTT